MTETTEQPPEPDVFEAYARLRAALSIAAQTHPYESKYGDHVLVAQADLRLILDVPLAHALSPEGITRALTALNQAHRYGRTQTHKTALSAAIKAALGGPR